MAIRSTRREVLAAGLAAGALPFVPRPAAAAGPAWARPSPSRSTCCATWRRAWRPRPTRSRWSRTTRLLEIDRLRPAQPDQLQGRPDALGRRPGGGEGALLPPGSLLQAAGADQRPEGRAGAGAEVLDRPLRHAGRPSGAQADAFGLRRLRGDGPRGRARLVGGARRVLFPHLGLLGPVRDVGARARDQLRADPGPEEFPRFTRFWLEQAPDGGLVIYALLESPRATGAYRMATAHHDGVFQDIDAALFLRGDIARLGIAPLTSMFWYGKNNHFVGPDWRPEIHDSDGLEMQLASGERIWRPLNNPPRVMANALPRRQRARLRARAARAELRGVPGRRRVLREARHRLGRAAGRLGRGVGDADRALDQRRDPRQHRRLLEPGGSGGARQPLRPALQAQLGEGLAAADRGAVHRHADRHRRRARAGAAGEPGQVRARPRRPRARGPRPFERGRGGGVGEPRRRRAWSTPTRSRPPTAGG